MLLYYKCGAYKNKKPQCRTKTRKDDRIMEMENKNIISEENQDNRYENITITDGYKGTMDMDDENPWFFVAANSGAA